MLKQSQPIFAVKDVKETIAFYQDVLGFESPWFWGDPVCYGGIGWGEIHVMFNQMPHIAANIEGHQHHFFTDDVNSLHDRHQRAGAPIIEPIGNKPWGLREYTVRDPNGYHLRFGGPSTYEKPATALETIPDFVRVEPRLPTDAEYAEIARSVNWTKTADNCKPLRASLFGAVAMDARTNQAVGMARVIEDAYAWYSIWDVAVHPDYQSKRIGTAMLESLLARLREVAPKGSAVHLFTFSHSFYARLGFVTDTCTKLKL